MPASLPTRWPNPAPLLVATDLSDLDTLMPHAIELALRSKARLILLHVLTPHSANPSKNTTDIICHAVEEVGVARLILKPWCNAAEARHLDCTIRIATGDPAREICIAAELADADRILLGTRNPDKKRKLELGSVAAQVLRTVNIPVITVAPEAHLQEEAGHHPPLVLHATTLRETSRPCAALACQFAAQNQARLLMLHVAPPIQPMRGQQLPSESDSMLLQKLNLFAQQAAASCGGELQVEPRLVHGNRLIEILATAAECHPCLIVLGMEGDCTFDNLTREHALLQVLAHARTPVMLLRIPCAIADEQPVPAAAAAGG